MKRQCDRTPGQPPQGSRAGDTCDVLRLARRRALGIESARALGGEELLAGGGLAALVLLQVADLGFGRIVASEEEAPIILANMV